MRIKKRTLFVVLGILLTTGCVKKEHTVPIIDVNKDNKNIQYRTLEDIHEMEGKFVSYEEYLRLSRKEF